MQQNSTEFDINFPQNVGSLKSNVSEGMNCSASVIDSIDQESMHPGVGSSVAKSIQDNNVASEQHSMEKVMT